ncbi:MAG TPA: hypothetical protein VFB63_15955 [Bryobacteraceae bacterium]|jgi:hypothetical protein|nr:hypothetical protein [Bryobacteraceae bacterium]
MKFWNFLLAGIGVVTPSLASAQGLDGLYLQMKFAFGNFQENHYFFLPDGRYLTEVPDGDLTAAGLDRACVKAPTQCGRYALQGGNLVLTPSKGKPDTLSIEKLPNGDLRIGGLFAKRVASFPAGTKLDGTYSRIESAGRVSAARTYTFRPDGTFSASGLGAVSTEQGVAKSQNSEAGTYRLNGHVLELVAGGKTTRIVAYPYDLGKGDVRLNLGGVFFKKQ